jgi:hypothetical protein
MTMYEKLAHNAERYTHFTPFRFRATSYLLALPPNRNDYKPDALLLKPAQGRLEQVCAFSIVEPNY